MSDKIFSLLPVVLPVLLTGLFGILLFWLQIRWQKKQEIENLLHSQPKLKAEATEITGKAYTLLIDQLEDEVKRLTESNNSLRSDLDEANMRIRTVETELVKERQERQSERDSLYATIQNLKDDLKSLGKTTDELRENTRPSANRNKS